MRDVFARDLGPMKWNYSTPSLDYLWLNLILAWRKTKPYFNKCHKTSEIPGAGTCGFLLAFQQTHLLGYMGMIKELHPYILLPQNQAKVGFQLHSEPACSRGPIHVTSWLWLLPQDPSQVTNSYKESQPGVLSRYSLSGKNLSLFSYSSV